MKKVYNIVFSFIHISLLVLICLTVSNGQVQSKTLLINNNNHNKQVSSEQICKKDTIVKITEKKQEIKKEVIVVDKKQGEKKSTKKVNENTEKKQEQELKNQIEKEVVIEQIEKYDVLESFRGNLAAYGSNCKGCSTKTSSGYTISKSVYYNDKDYGKIRILAGDKKYPYGTIVKLRIDTTTEIIGVVLDRGGDIGIGKRFQFDLLFQTEKEASVFGSKQNVQFEVLRLGY